MASLRSWLRALADGCASITLDPSPRLRKLRLEQEAQAREAHARLRALAEPFGPLPPLPDSAYTPEGALMEPQVCKSRGGRYDPAR